MEACLLNTQYRMHSEIAAFPSAQFYEGRVQSGTSPGSRAGMKLSSKEFNRYSRSLNIIAADTMDPQLRMSSGNYSGASVLHDHDAAMDGTIH